MEGKIIKIAVIGSRGFFNYNFFKEKLEYLIQNIKEDIVFVSGGAKSGGDALIKRYCEENNLPLIEFLPEYDKYPPKIAPIKRNQQIVDESDIMIAFWDNSSRGTKSAIEMGRKKRIIIKIVKI